MGKIRTPPLVIKAWFRADIPRAGDPWSGFGLKKEDWTNSIQLTNLGEVQQLAPFTRVEGLRHDGTPFQITPNKLYNFDIRWFEDEAGNSLANFRIDDHDLGTLSAPVVPLEYFVAEREGHKLDVYWYWWNIPEKQKAIIGIGLPIVVGLLVIRQKKG